MNSLNVSQFGIPTSEMGPFDYNATFNVRDRMLPQAIRATAGLLYWFAKEAGLLPQPLVSVSLMGDFTLYAGGNGNWWVSLENGIEPFTFNWQIMYLDGVGYLKTFESVKKEKEKKDKDKKKDGDIIIEAVPSNYWFSIGTNSSYFSKPHNPYDLRDFKLRCIVTDATNTTKTSNEFYVDVVSYPPEFSIVQIGDSKEQSISLAKESEVISMPRDYSLDQNYPNPFNPSTTIEYQLPSDGFVSLRIFDLLGSEVKTLVNEYKTKGRYSTTFDASNLASGLYIYQLKSNNFSSIKKMILSK